MCITPSPSAPPRPCGVHERRPRAALLVAAAAACLGASLPAQPAPIGYRVPPSAGKLPIPLHDPAFDRAQHDSLVKALWIPNNHALYQGDRRDSVSPADWRRPRTRRPILYLHGGLDFAAPDGTRVFAITSGTVRAIDTKTEFYRSIVVEGDATPVHGWQYAHVDGFQVAVGDRVPQGASLARIRFRGLEHVHMNRVRLITGGDRSNVLLSAALQNPTSFFALPDSEPPVIAPGFRYFRNESDSAFAAGSGDAPPVVSGDVDVHDRAPWARPSHDS